MLMERHIRFVTKPLRFRGFGLNAKECDAVDYTVNCYVISAKESERRGAWAWKSGNTYIYTYIFQ